jgi:hypothetical protein
MVLSCWTISHLVAARLVNSVVRTTRHGFPRIGRHVAQHARHAFHAASVHPPIWVESVCRLAPGALAVGLLGLSPPLRGPILQPPTAVNWGSSPPVANPGPVVLLLPLGATGLDAMGAPRVKKPKGDTGSTIITMPAGDLPTDTPAPVTSGPPDVGPTLPSEPPPTQVLPEPSSLWVIGIAIGGLGLLAATSRRRRLAASTASCRTGRAVD